MPVVNNPSTVIVVHAYSGDLNQVENNLPFYTHHQCPVVILSPQDAPIKRVSDSRVLCMSGGMAGWIGPHTLERELTHFRMLVERFPYVEHFLLNDADSLCLSAQLPDYLYRDPRLFWSNEVRDTNPSPSKLPKLALQPPYFVHRETLVTLLGVREPATSYYGEPTTPQGWPMPIPTDCIDHFLLQLVYAANLPHYSFHTGASFETNSDVGLEAMLHQVRSGKVLLHSVKRKTSLDALAAAHLGR